MGSDLNPYEEEQKAPTRRLKDLHEQQEGHQQDGTSRRREQQDGQESAIPVKKPPGTWSIAETGHLIDAYQEKWYELRRGQLRTCHWDEVAKSLAARCPGVDPVKSSMQCRHKMEKLRRRYRSERQIIHRKGGISQWPFYEKIESMEKGPGYVDSAAAVHGGPVAAAAVATMSAGAGLLESRKREFLRPDLYRAPRERDREREMLRDKHKERERKRKLQVHEPIVSADDDDSEPQHLSDDDALGENEGSYTSLNGKHGLTFDYDPVSSHKTHDCRFLKFPTKPSSRHHRRPAESAPLTDLVSAVRWLGEGFLKMEQMKVQMQRENERQRIDMELRRTELVLNCQRQIAEAFTNALVSSRRNKKFRTQED